MQPIPLVFMSVNHLDQFYLFDFIQALKGFRMSCQIIFLISTITLLYINHGHNLFKR